MRTLTSEEQRWLNGLHEFDRYNENIILGVFACFGIPKSYLDVGCGTGAMVKCARLLGVNAKGVDILPHEDEDDFLIEHDLNIKLDLFKEFEIVTSIEVAEHTREECEGEFNDTLVRHVAKGGLLILTAAPPGQVGDGHINMHEKPWWVDRIESRGMKYHRNKTKRLASIWENSFHPSHWIENNLMVFEK